MSRLDELKKRNSTANVNGEEDESNLSRLEKLKKRRAVTSDGSDLTAFAKDYESFMNSDYDEETASDLGRRITQLQTMYDLNRDNLSDDEKELRSYLNKAKYSIIDFGNPTKQTTQEDSEYKDLMSSEDFTTNSGYVSSKSDKWWERLWTDYSLGYADVQHEYINDQNGLRDEIKSKYRAASRDNIFSDGELIYEERGYDYLTDEEISIYNYYYNTEGKEKAQEFLDSLEDTLVQRKAGKEFEALEGETIKEIFYGVVTGAEQFASGIEGLGAYVTGDKGHTPSSQYVSGYIREDLADDGFKILGSSVGQIGYDLVNTTSNMLPSILVGAATGGVGGAVTLGLSSIGNAYTEMRRLGYDENQARAYATLVGASEATLQYALGGISKLGGKITGNVVNKFVSGLDNAFAKVAINLGGSMVSEGLEESIQTVIEPVFKAIVTGEDYEAAELEEILYSGLLGALSAGMLEGGGTVSGEISANTRAKRIYGDGSALVTEALGVATDGSDLSNLANKYKGKLDGGKSLSGAQIVHLDEAIASNDSDIIKKATLQRLGELGETHDVTPIAEVLTKYATGETLTSKDISILNESDVGHQVLAELNRDNIKSGSLANNWAESIGTRRVSPESYNKTVYDRAEAHATAMEAMERGSVFKTVEDVEGATGETIKTSESGKTIYEDAHGNAENVTVQKIVSTKGGVKVELDNGKTVSASDLRFATKEEGLMYEMVARMEVTPETANEIIKTFKPSTVQQATMFFTTVPLAYQYGKIGYEAGLKNINLPKAQKQIAYNRGRMDAITDVKTKPKATASKKGKTTTTTKSGIIFEGDFTYDESTATEMQKQSMIGIEVINMMSNLEVHIFESKVVEVVKDGKKVKKRVAIVNGKERSAPNGYFRDGNKIYIDINAGNGGEGAMLYTMSHEVGHYIKQWNAKGFKELGDFLIAEYGKQGVPVNYLLEKQKEKIRKSYEEDGKTLPSDAKLADMAYEELVCDAMSDMFTDPKAYEKLAKLKQKNRTLWEKLGEAIKSLLDKLKTALGIYKDKDIPVAREAHFVRGFSADAYNKLQDLYIKAFVEADANFAAAEETLASSGIMVDSSTESATIYSVRDGLDDKQRQNVSKALATRFGVTQKEAMDWLKAETSMASLILNPKYSQYLDYTPDPNETAIKQNSDYPQGTVDFSPICAKRREFTSVMNNILRLFPNHVFAATDLAKIRTIMQEEGMTIPCGICYVEDRRQLDTIVAQNFIDSLKLYREGSKTRPDGKAFNANQLKGLSLIDGDSYTPSVYELVSLEGLNVLKEKNPNMAEAWIKFNNARGMQSVRLLANEAEYKRQILKYTKQTVKAKNDKGGLRVYSFSDAEMFHLIDIIQVITDSATVGLSLQGYTKVNEYARAVKDTGEKLNRSLIPKGELGYHIEDGKVVLDYDTVEGIDITHPDFFDNRDNPNVGNITIGVSDVQIRAAMVSDFVDQIIPFHTGQSEEVLGEKGISTWSNYKDYQTEKDIATGKVSDHQINIYTEVLQVLEKEGKPITKRTFVEKFLQVCKENGLTPRFSQFLNTNESGEYVYTEGYHKMLVDFKTFAQTEVGEYLPQMPVKPIFDDKYITKILKDYVKSQKVKDAELAESMPKVIERITNEIVKPSDGKVSDSDPDGQVLFSVREEYASELDEWRKDGMPDGESFVLGTTGDILQGLGAIENDIYLQGDKIKEILSTHPEMTLDEIKKIPQILENPILILKSRNVGRNNQHNTRLVIFGSVKAKNGQPILSVMDLRPLEKHIVIDDMQKVTSAYTKTHEPVEFIRNSYVLYADKKKATSLLRSIGFQMPIELNKSGFVGSISYKGRNVNIFGEKFSDVFLEGSSDGDKMYSDRDSEGNELSAEQQKFFKDSKVRDEEGRLLVLHRGSPEDFGTVFKFLEENLNSKDQPNTFGFFFTDSHETAEYYSKARGNEGDIKTVYLNIEHPLDLTSLGISSSEKEFYRLLEENGVITGRSRYKQDYKPVWARFDKNGESMRRSMESAGFDGVVYHDWGENKATYVAFYPEQIKFITNKTPTSDPDIRFADRDSYAPTFYSHMGKVIDGIKLDKMGANGVVPYLKGKGVKDEEIKWSGIETFLEGKKSVTKAELQEFVAGSQLVIEEEMSGEDIDLRYDGTKRAYNLLDEDGNVIDTFTYNEFLNGYVAESDEEIYSNPHDLIAALRDEYGKSSAPRWEDYKLDGGTNYRELVFKLPNSTHSNRAMRGHWGQDAEGILVHARVQDFDVNGKKMLFIEELQSDWHNEGLQKGYTTQEYEDAVAVYDRLAEDYNNKRKAFNKYVRSSEFRSDPDDVSKKKFDWLRRKMETAEKRMQDAERDIEALKAKGMGDVPDAPFRSTYHEYVLKRLLRMAAEEGYDAIGWTPSEIQSDRWSEDYAEAYRIEYDQDIPKFLRKYGKKWGATVGNATVNDTGVWSMDITDSMTESVLHEGQPLYSDRDTTYMDAVNRGDMKTAQRMVEEAAREAGYTVKAYHGTNSKFTEFREIKTYPGYWFSTSKKYASEHGKEVKNVYLKTDNILPETRLWEEAEKAFGESVSENDIYTQKFREHLLRQGYKGIEFEHSGARTIIVFEANQIKSADPITYDDNGKVIPLSERFNPNNNDIRFSERDPDAISNRTLLANALESVAQNSIERTKLEQYKNKIAIIERAQAKLAEIRAEAQALRFKKGRTEAETRQLRVLDAEATRIENRISTYDKQLLSLETTTALKNVLQREKAMLRRRLEQKGKEAVKAQRQKDAATIREIMTRNTESRKKAVENRHKTEMRHKIQKVVSDLNKLLLNPTKDQHVPIGLQGVVAEALDAINMDTMNAEERVAYYNDLIARSSNPDEIAMLERKRDFFAYRDANFKDKITALKNAYAEFKESDDPLIRNAHNEAIENLIRNTADAIGNKSLKDMSYEQLNAVYDMYKAILATVRNSNKLFKEGRQETISDNSEAVKAEVREVGGHKDRVLKLTKALKKFGWGMLKPVTAMKAIGSKTLAKLFDNVRAGEDTWAVDISEAKQFYDDMSAKYGFKKWDFKKRYTFKDSTGTDFTLSLEQIMSLYAYSKREQADKHLEFGGFIFDDAIEVTEKKLGIPLKYEVNDANPYRLRTEDLLTVVSALTTEQKGFVDEMQTYLSDVMGAKGNEVSLAMYDIKLYNEKTYFPLKTSRYFREFDPEKSATPKIKNAGFSKKTVPQAGNPIVLSNFMDVWAGHVNDMSMYHAFVLPLEDFMRVYNYSSTAGGYDSVQQYIKNAYGAQANQYIEKLMDDLNGGARVDPSASVINQGLSLFKKASVFASASVVVQQPSAIARALAYINPKYFATSAGSALNLSKHKSIWAEIKKYAPIAVIKEMGYFDTGMGRSTVEWIKGNQTIKDKMDDVLSKAPAMADELSWSYIWLAVKNEIKATTDLAVGSEEFLKRCGKRFTEVITNSQVYDSVLSRSDMMRSKDTGMKMATAFMAEPTTTVNMMVDGILQGKRGNKKFTAATVGAVASSVILNSILVALVYAARDDDEDETYAEKYVGSLTSELLDGFNPLTYIPFVKDIWSIAQGYDVERSDMSVVSKLWESIEGMFNEDKSGWEKVLEVTGAVSSLFGIPLKNIIRDAKGMFNLAETVMSGTPTTGAGIADAITDSFKSSIPLWDRLIESDTNADRLYKAILSGDQAQINRIKGRFKDDKAIESAMRQGLRENDSRIKEAAQARYEGNIAEYTRIAKEIIAEGNFSQDTIVSAINSELTSLKKGDATENEPAEDKDEATSIYSASDVNVAFNSGDNSTALAIIDDLINTKMANGKTKKEAQSSIRSSMTSYWKPLYKQAYQSGNYSEMERIRRILYSSGLYGTANDVVKTAKEWLKD